MMEAATMQNESYRPERTCAGCRARDDRNALARFVLGPDGRLVPDATRKLPGRGVSVHPRRGCILAAAKRGGFARAFRRPISADAEELARQLGAQYRRRIDGLILAASRKRALALGTEAVRTELRRDTTEILIVAADAAGRREELERMAERLGDRCVVYGSKADLGRLFGRDEVGVLAVEDRGLANEIAHAAACISALEGKEG